MSEQITHDAEHQRYVIADGDERLGMLSYSTREDAVSLDSTVVLPQYQGRGIAGRLVKHVLDDLRDTTTKRVEPNCSYVVDYLQRHPEYADLTTRT
ncbi:N-acetyltransferase [Pseudoclavibacter endophyticus]|nr:GNAT family N-acetyltransferase [Pseudoclavibacter endophyticus]GGA66728.1 N-acetyltransferase [Pseudoclavibacter endophyticus]